jgi:hypothetical protein
VKNEPSSRNQDISFASIVEGSIKPTKWFYEFFLWEWTSFCILWKAFGSRVWFS